MAATYTRLLGAVRQSGLQTVVLYTASTAHTTIVRDLVAFNEGATAAYFLFYVDTGSTTWALYRRDVPAGTTGHEELRQELPAGSRLMAQSNASSWTATATGYLLTSA